VSIKGKETPRYNSLDANSNKYSGKHNDEYSDKYNDG
jgi:hypothetical protein